LRTYNPATNADVLNLAYGYTNPAGANNGNVTSFNSTATQIFMRTYTYDSLNRLSTMSSPADASGCYGLSWTYDRYGNRLSQSATSGGCFSPSHGVFPNNRISDAGFSYDASGNMTHDATHSYTYDAEGRLTQVDGGATATYVYDAEGQRIQKTTDGAIAVYLRNPQGQLVAETDGGDTLLRVGYAHAFGELLAEYENNSTYFIHKDHLGSTRVMTKIDGSVYDSMDYLPYGEQIAGGTGTTHKFTGKERDGESGLDYFGARYMGSSLGRFMSPDPLLNSGRPTNPQTWNRYSYVLNNPLNFIDPTGLFEWGASLGGNKPDSEVSQEIRNKRAAVLAAVAANRSHLDAIKAAFGEKSSEYKNAKASVDAIGTLHDGKTDNVHIGLANDGQTSPGLTTPGANGNIYITFQAQLLNPDNSSSLEGLLAHEGFHAWETNNGKPLGTYGSEYNGQSVQAAFGQVRNPNGFSFFILGTGSSEKHIEYWNSSWAEADRAANRDKAIRETLTTPKSEGGYGFKPPTGH
jgi:RHS repeat-associated protein